MTKTEIKEAFANLSENEGKNPKEYTGFILVEGDYKAKLRAFKAQFPKSTKLTKSGTILPGNVLVDGKFAGYRKGKFGKKVNEELRNKGTIIDENTVEVRFVNEASSFLINRAEKQSFSNFIRKVKKEYTPISLKWKEDEKIEEKE